MEPAQSQKIASLRIERKLLSDLNPHPRNPRVHAKPGSPEWEALRASLGHDYFDPLVWNQRNGFLVSGHFRHKVLTASGFTHADVSVVDYDDATHLARLVAANQLLGEWEESLLASLAEEINKAGLSAGLAGWSEKDLAALIEGPSVEDDTHTVVEIVSAADDLAKKWNVAPGDLFRAGSQILLCADCTRPENWARLLGSEKADMLWTDPPYNVAYDARRIDRESGAAVESSTMQNDDLSPEAYVALLNGAFSSVAERLKPGAAFYVAHAESSGLAVRKALMDAGLNVTQCLVWVKNSFTLGRQDYQWQHEPILYGWKPGAAHYWQGGFSQSTVIDDEPRLEKMSKEELLAHARQLRNDRQTTVVREARGTGDLHPTIKPLPLVARQIWNSSQRGDLIVEPFGGSGTTLIAAEQTGRRGAATEIDPKFCAVILERMTLAGLKVEKVSHESC